MHREPAAQLRPAGRRPTRSRLALAAAVAVALVAGAGCSFGDGDRGDAGPPTTEAVVPTTLVPAIEVLGAGAAPLSERRLRFTAGSTATLSLRVDLSIEQDADGAAQALDAPAVTQQVTLTVGEVAADGASAEVELEIGEVGVDREGTDLTDGEVTDLAAELGALTGLRATGTIGARGEVTAFEYLPPEGASARTLAALDDVAAQLAGVTIPLPEEAIGVGARWRATTTSELGGVTVTQEATYELTSVDGDRLGYSATVVQHATPGALPADRLPAGTTARVVSSDVRGTTTGTADLAGLAATLDTDLGGTQVVELTGPGGTAQATQRLTLQASIEPVG